MSEWLKSPKGFAPGTKMTFAGLGSPEERAAIILFLNQKDDSPLPVPAAPDQGVAAAEGQATDATSTGETPATAEKEPVVGNTAADTKGGGPAAR
jgi:cytochrome c